MRSGVFVALVLVACSSEGTTPDAEPDAAPDATWVSECDVDVDCFDGDYCTVDTCAQGLCSWPALDLDDGKVCTTDACDPELGVSHDVPISLYDDHFDDGDDDLCTWLSCDPVTGALVPDQFEESPFWSECDWMACEPDTGPYLVGIDDGVDCTHDYCMSADAVHDPDDSQCPEEEHCDVQLGCVPD